MTWAGTANLSDFFTRSFVCELRILVSYFGMHAPKLAYNVMSYFLKFNAVLGPTVDHESFLLGR